MRGGYDEDFLGVHVPFPTFKPGLETQLFTDDQHSMKHEKWMSYIHYSVVTNREKRQPVIVALNIDQDKLKKTRRGYWKTDERIGEYQLDNDYYKNNHWDRGHLARRASSAWGETQMQAKDASDDTMYYTNAVLQHRNLNQDEWVALENWVKDLEHDQNNKITVFSGPIYGQDDENKTKNNDHGGNGIGEDNDNGGGGKRFIKPNGRERAEIPAAFFKVVAFIDKKNQLAVRSFIMVQDRMALSDSDGAGRRMFDLKTYQVTLKMIMKQTGILFPEQLVQANPLWFNPSEKSKKVGADDLPEIVPISGPSEILGPDSQRPKSSPHSKILIAAAMVNPEGADRKNEWVTISNFSNQTVDLTGWSLWDTKRKPLPLNGKIESGESIKVKPLSNQFSTIMLANTGGAIVLFDNQQKTVDRVQYSRVEENIPTIFHMDF